jgi:predicted metallo-beta-lactamase superfamily hydrolase
MPMLKRIKVVPLAAESYGVRSMCTYVETPDVRILLDAGVSLCPNRFGLPPHPREFEAIGQCRQRISESAQKARIVTISHYHYDHHTPSFEDWLVNWTKADETAKDIYQDKILLVKNPREQINSSQRERGWMFAKTGGTYAEKTFNADFRSFAFGATTLEFSQPVFHGPENSEMGWVLMTSISFQDEKFMFAPDVQGPMSSRTLQLILGENPRLLMIGGPPIYLVPSRVSEHQLQLSLKNLREITRKVPHVILDHHILRDVDWQQKTTEILYEAYNSDSILQTAAEFAGGRNAYLEANRKTLFEENPVTNEFGKWMKLPEEKKKLTPPPI